MINGINISALSEFSNEVIEHPAEAKAKYGVNLKWQSGTKSKISTKTMELGNHRSIRSFEMGMDEPRSLLGLNTAPNPQEYLMAGLAGCMSVVFMAGAALMNIKIESLQIDIDGELDLTGFLHSDSDTTAGLPQIDYTIRVKGTGTEEDYQSLITRITRHSPNYATLANPVELIPHLIIED
jgi:uncharacterized OsmC-like protein